MIVKKQTLTASEIFLIAGLNQVTEEYFEMSHLGDEIILQKPERVFNAELYHQLRKLQENGYYEVGRIHPDLVKHIKLHLETTKVPPAIINNLCIGDFHPKKISPDIVFHTGQDNIDNQLLVAELKMDGASRINIINDLQKLLFYKLSALQFKNAVFIYTGSKKDLERKLEFGISKKMLECLIKQYIFIALHQIKGGKKMWNIYQFNNNHVNN